MKLFLVGCVMAVLMGCSTTPRVSAGGDGDGSAPNKAVVLAGQLDGESIQALEKEWIGKHYPGARMTVKVISKAGLRKLEHVRIVLPDGGNRDVFFDISGAEGRYPTEREGQVIQGKP